MPTREKREKSTYTPETAAAWLRDLSREDADALRVSAERRIYEQEKIVRTSSEMRDDTKAALADTLNSIDDPIRARTRIFEGLHRFANAEHFAREFVAQAAREMEPERLAARDLTKDGRGLPSSELRQHARERLQYHVRSRSGAPYDPDELDRRIDTVLVAYAADMACRAADLAGDIFAALRACD